MWVTKLLIFPVKIRIFCPRTTKFGLKLAFLPGLAGSFGALLVGWLVVVARAVSRKTPINFIKLTLCSFVSDSSDLFDPGKKVLNSCIKSQAILIALSWNCWLLPAGDPDDHT